MPEEDYMHPYHSERVNVQEAAVFQKSLFYSQNLTGFQLSAGPDFLNLSPTSSLISTTTDDVESLPSLIPSIDLQHSETKEVHLELH